MPTATFDIDPEFIACCEAAVEDDAIEMPLLQRRRLRRALDLPKNSARRKRRLAMMQMRAREELGRPTGKIDWSKVDWAKLLELFLKLLPLILAIL